MGKATDKFKFFMVLFTAVIIFYSCRDHEHNVPLMNADLYFEKSIQRVHEGGLAVVQIKLENKSSQDVFAEVMFETNGVNGQHFVTYPPLDNGHLFLKIHGGCAQISFTVAAADNDSFDGGKFVRFTLANSTSIKLTTHTIIIEDNEAPVTVNFAESKGAVSEKSNDGLMVELQLSQPAIGSGKLYIINSDPQALGSFISHPPLSGNLIELVVNEGDAKVGFRVVPIDETVCQDRILNFMLAATYGSMKSGDDISFDLTIQDAEATRISFTEPGGSVDEGNGVGKDIQISIQPPANEKIRLYVGVPNYDGDNKYTTVPAINYDPVGGSYILIDIPIGATSTSFKVIPKNNLDMDDNYDIGFILYPVNNNCFLVPFEEVYQLTIINDD